MALTAPACKNAKCFPDEPRSRYADAGGLYLEVASTATKDRGKNWYWKYRFGGKKKRLALGSYPSIGLADARRAREAARLFLKGAPIRLLLARTKSSLPWSS